MRSFTVSFFSLMLAAVVSAKNAQAQPPSESEFVGMYTQGGFESQAQIFLLDDNTFCYTFMGGSLDLIKAGRWKHTKGVSTVNLQEIRPDSQIYPAYGKNLDRLGPPMVRINFDGYTLSNARSPVFAVSNTDKLPTTFRPLFPSGKSRWSGTYSLPLMAPETAKYFIIGDVEVDKFERPVKLRLTQYKIENYDTIRIAFNEMQVNPAMNIDVQLINNVLHMGGSKFVSKKPLNTETLIDVREQCVNPILFPDRVSSDQKYSQEQLPGNTEILKPLKSFNLELAAITGEPIFGADDEGASKGNDSIDGLIDAEQKLLQETFDSAKSETQPADNFMQLANNLAGKKRINRHAPMLVKLYADLLVAKVAKGKMPVAEKMFFNFMENIYPAVHSSKREEVVYALSVIASQGLIITVATKNDEIRKLVFEKLLGDKFDITTHKNRALIYNLACYYATINNKVAMIDAIKQARKRGTPPKQFMDDTDFNNYWKDAEFLDTIKG